MKKMLNIMFSFALVSALALPVAVGAVGIGGACTGTGAECDPGLKCSVETGSGTCITDPQGGQYGLKEFTDVGLNQNNDIKGSIANIINIVLGFLGIVAVIIILAGGFKWMTAGGNEDKVAESRQMIIQGVIGLVVIFAAWAIASFVISSLQSATS